MINLETLAECRQALATVDPAKKIGFVPTMGALHQGHAALIKRAKEESDVVLVSIFVNPTQFNEQADYQAYPNTLAEDAALLKKLKVDYLFLPEEKTMYPTGHDFTINPQSEIASILEGAARPGHFAGMLTIVMKLLLLIRPDYAYFGEKDYQQVLLIEQMVESFFLATVIVRCPIERKSSGLPFSSRNTHLSANDRKTVENVYQIIKENDFSDLPKLAAHIREVGVDVEYLQQSLQRIFIAMRTGNIRLIDNFLV